MRIIDSHNVYSYVLKELEWYGVNDAAKLSTIENCLEGARRAGRPYASIRVEPDAIMSISPIPHPHRVWGHTFKSQEEAEFEDALRDLYGSSKLPGMVKHAAIKRIFGI